MNSAHSAFAFSADPVTLGHEKLIESAAKADQDLKVVIATSAAKQNSRTFAIPESVKMVRESIGHIIPPENIYTASGSLARHFLLEDVGVLYRGTRNVVDEAYEAALEFFYKSEHPELQIVRLRSSADVGEVSSSAVKEILSLGHNIENFVRPNIKASLESRLLDQYPIGITGLSGSGKSRFSERMTEIGAKNGIEVHHIDYDTIAHQIYSPDITPEPFYEKIRRRLGEVFPGVRNSDGSIHRGELRKYVFDSKNASENLEKLNHIMQQAMRFRYSEIITGKKGILLVDAALLAKHEMTSIANHASVIVEADEELRIKRIADRGEKAGKPLSKDQIRSQISSQATAKKMKDMLLSVVEKERHGFVAEFDNTDPKEGDYEKAFWGMVAKLDIFGEIRGGWIFEKLGIPRENARNMLLEIRKRYNQNGRHHHIWAHVVEVLDAVFDPRFPLDETERITLGLAAIGHDLVYSTNSKDSRENETRSVTEFEKCFAGILGEKESELLDEAKKIIIDQGNPKLRDLFHDFDYAVLGSESQRYRAYQEDIRREWTAAVPARDFVAGRRAFLEKLLASKSPIFRTKPFQDALEAITRVNISTELSH